MHWTFGTFVWSVFVVFLWFAVIWMFIALLADIFRRDMPGWAKAGWVVLIVLLPFIGILAYVITRPRTAGVRLAPSGGRTDRTDSSDRADGYSRRRPADEIATAARLHDDGKITAAEFEQLKHHALSK